MSRSSSFIYGLTLAAIASMALVGDVSANVAHSRSVRQTGSGGTPDLPLIRARLDFDGDGKTDYAVTRASGTQKVWYYSESGSSTTRGAPWGLNGDREIAADFDGDGITDIGVWRDSHAGGDPNRAFFYVLRSSDNTILIAQFGKDGDDPAVVGDYDGDGKADPAVFRASGTTANPCGSGNSVFYYRPSGSEPLENFVAVCWGSPGDVPTGGDFDGDGKFDFCVRRNINGAGAFLIKRSSDDGEEAAFWGLPTDTIVPGDYDGDGRYDFAVARVNGTNLDFYLRMRSGGGTGAEPIVFGNVNPLTDHLAPGDYDGDGKQDLAVMYQSASPGSSYFVVRRSDDGGVQYFPFGLSGDNVPAEWTVTGGF